MASLMILAWGASVLAAEGPIDSTISYQGRLTNGGDPAEGQHDMRFSLYDAVSGGNQVGPTLVFDGDQPNPDPVDVVAGLFQVGLTFGNGVFLGDALWLEIEVRPHADGSYVPLDPRQPLTAVPYALYALDGPGGGGGFWGANGTHIYKNNSGNVGIGTTNPQTMLDVFGEDAVLRVESIRNDFGPKLVFRNRTTGRGVYQGTIQFQDANDTLAEVGYRRPRFGVPRLSLVTVGGGIAIFDGGEVGIGDVPTPDAKLHVVGGATSAVLGATSSTEATDYGVRGESSSTSGGSGVLGVGRFGVNGIANTLNGFGGVFGGGGAFGSGPSLWVVGDALVSAGLRVGSTGLFEPATVKLHIENGTDVSPEGGGFVVIGDFGRLNIGIDGNEIMARNNGAVSTLFLNHEGGDVRIGQNGGSTTVYVPVLAITGADLAEKFAISGPLDEAQPGTVMEIDPHNAGKLRVARGVYTRRVAGVVSGAGDIPTGAILGNLPGFEDAPPVALSGRVWVKCDASQTAIEPGDLLTTSATPGHAMAVRDFTRSPGATLGKAMTPLAKGESGLVLVLVSLQ